MRIRNRLLTVVILVSFISTIHAQPCTALGQNPSTAFPVCGTNTFVQTNVPSCGGQNIPGACGASAGLADLNPYWYKFTCFTAGTLGFVITPVLASDDYDWQVFDITGRNPNDVYTDGSLFVVSNWSQFTGPTGATPAGTGLIHCAGNTANISAMPTLIVGHQYLLLVSNYSNSNQGYTLVFAGGTASITDPIVPLIRNASANCDGTQITVRFNKKIKCSSLTTTGSEFTISPSGTIVSATGYGCSSGFDTDSVLLTLSAPLTAGNYTVTAVNGTDANTLLDNCDRAIVVGVNTGLTIDPPVPLPMGTVTPPACAPTSITLTFADPIKCNSVAANGSDFTITGPSGVTVSSATAVGCTPAGETNTITLQLSAPILTSGNYLVKIRTGSDGNTVAGQCNRQVTEGDAASFTVAPQAPIAMGTIAPLACAPISATINFAEPIKCNSIAANGSDFIVTGPSAVTVFSATPVSCNGSGDATGVTILFTSSIVVSGNYNVQMAAGSDGNTLVGNCGRQTTAGDLAPFTIAPQAPIAMGTITPPPCAPAFITITFAEPIKCNSVAVNGSDFIVTGPSAVVISAATPVSCNASGEATGITIQFSTAILVTGTYNVQMATGNDGNTILGNCGRQVTAGEIASFTLAPQTPLPMGTVTPPPCTPTSIIITFAEPILCSTIRPTDFLITGPSTVTISGTVPPTCNGVGETNTIELILTSPITVTGTYQVQIVVGADGNTLLGQCGRQVPAGSTAPFTLAAQTPIAMGTVTPPPCTPTSVTITFADPVKCTSIAANGSDFVVTGPSAVTVSLATPVNCNAAGEATAITIQFASAILVTGAYNVQMATGSDGNTLLGNCGRQTTVGDLAPFTLAAQTPIAMGTVTPPPCTPTSVTITFAEPVKCTSIAANGSDFVVTGPSAVTVSSATAVNCNAAGETTAITIQFASAILVTGAYNIQMATGSDGNTLLGNCGRQTTVGGLAPFTLAPQAPIAMGTVTPPLCIPGSITITFAEPIKCNSVAANGSDFVVTGPSTVTVSSATAVNCDPSGETTVVTIRFATPILATGTFTVQMATGSDGNTLMGNCGRQVTAGSNVPFTLAPQPPMPMGTITQPNCSPSTILLNFPVSFDCTSIAANGSDFMITGPSTVTISGAHASCAVNPSNTITIDLASPITVAGTYTLQVKTGTDGNTIHGGCQVFLAVGSTTGFTIPVAPASAMNSFAPVGCSPSSLDVVFDLPVRCASIAANGSDFIITGPSPVTITSATGTCDANGLTTKVTLQLASPVVRGGTYQLQIAAGADGNTLANECNRPTPAGSAISFTASDTVSAEFIYQVQYDCETDVIDFSHDGQHNVNQWTWTVNGTAAGNSQTLTQSFSASSQNQVQLVVSNGTCSDTYSTNIVLNNKVTIDFEGPETICPEDTVFFINKSKGGVDTWTWDFANGNTSGSQTPPGQVYPLTGMEMLYTISLTGSNNFGCQATTTHTVKVLSGCIIAVPSAFTPNNDGLNDYLYPINAIKAEKLDFRVYNRWGQLVFRSTDWTQKWDGRISGIAQPTNVYVWTLEFTHRDTKQKYSLRGTTTLIR